MTRSEPTRNLALESGRVTKAAILIDVARIDSLVVRHLTGIMHRIEIVHSLNILL